MIASGRISQRTPVVYSRDASRPVVGVHGLAKRREPAAHTSSYYRVESLLKTAWLASNLSNKLFILLAHLDEFDDNKWTVHKVHYLVCLCATLVHVTDHRGWTPLHYAARKDSLEVAQFLVQKGANVHAVDRGGYTALHLAAQIESKRVFQYLIRQCGADITTTNKNGLSLLQDVIRYGSIDMLRCVVGTCGIGVVDRDGQTLLHHAAAVGCVKKTCILVELGANIEVMDAAGRTALYLASAGRHYKLILYLLDHSHSDLGSVDASVILK